MRFIYFPQNSFHEDLAAHWRNFGNQYRSALTNSFTSLSPANCRPSKSLNLTEAVQWLSYSVKPKQRCTATKDKVVNTQPERDILMPSQLFQPNHACSLFSLMFLAVQCPNAFFNHSILPFYLIPLQAFFLFAVHDTRNHFVDELIRWRGVQNNWAKGIKASNGKQIPRSEAMWN